MPLLANRWRFHWDHHQTPCDETRPEFLEKDFGGASFGFLSREWWRGSRLGFEFGGLSSHRRVPDIINLKLSWSVDLSRL